MFHHPKYNRTKAAKWTLSFFVRGFCPVVFWVMLLSASFDRAAAQEAAAIRWVSGAGKVAVEVHGLDARTLGRLQRLSWKPAQWQRLFAVHAGDESLPPMLGAYRIQSNALRFEPQFPLEPGITYRAVFRPGRLPGLRGAPVTATFQLPPRDSTPTTVVTRIYPSADLLPENLLKFYVHFSAPMRRGNIYDHIHLRDGAGKAVELPFLEIDEELWDPTMTRLTLFIDPGRIKRGVLPLEEIGPSLEEGKSYSLVIDREWRDGNGIPLKEEFQKAFRVGPADREPPDHTRWRIASPPAATREPLIVNFGESMDHALAQRMIRVFDSTGQPVAGSVTLEDHERRWTFTPDKPWPRGPHQLIIQTTIEDLAGNNIGKPFEVDLFNGIQRNLAAATVKLPFAIR